MGDNPGQYQDLLSAALGASGLDFDIDDIGLEDDVSTQPDSVLAAAIAESGLGDSFSTDSGNDALLAALKTEPPTIQQVQHGVQPRTTFIVQSRNPNDVKMPIHTTPVRLPTMPAATRIITQRPPTGMTIMTRPQNHPTTAMKVTMPVQSMTTARTNSPTVVKLQPTSQPGVVAMTAIPAVTTMATNNGGIKRELSHKDVSRLWTNEDLKTRSFSPTPTQQPTRIVVQREPEEEDVDEDEDDLGHTETYANYRPSKLKLGIDHPDPVVETSSLSSILPPNIWYNLSIPEHTIDYGHLSALQLEAIIYACQQHETFLTNGDRAGFLVGDGAGVGKGRTVAGIIYENYLLGRKRALWLSVSNDLKYDAARDLKDIGAGNISVHSLNKFKYLKISSKENGNIKKGVIFATYSSLIGESQSNSNNKYRTRLKQLLQWCGEDFDGCIVLDECHKAKNLCPSGSSKPTKTGLTVLELQRKLPKARVVYCSATGATEPRNMAYMTRLGIWGKGTPFKEFTDFIPAVERRGVGAMEIVAMDMKLRGMYMARQLSFAGVTFKIDEIPLSKEFVKMYDKAVQLWVLAREKFQDAASLIDADHRMKKTMWGQFWSAHQRFFKYLCIASKVKQVVKIGREAVKDGKCVVIGLQSTGEARTLDVLEQEGGELSDFVSTAKGVFSALIERHFPAPDRRKTADIFGIDIGRSASNSPEPKGNKRKATKAKVNNTKRMKKPFTHGFSSDDNCDSGKGANQSDDDNSDDSDSWDENITGFTSNEEDDFNPFKDSGDSDDDPWLKERKPKSSKPKTKTKKSTTKVEQDYPDDICSSVLLAAGLKPKPWNKSNTSLSSMTRTPSSSSLTGLSSSNNTSAFPTMDAIERAQSMKLELLDTLEEVSEDLPPNTLDELIDLLGGPENVAEMTGRKGRVVSNDDGTVTYESRCETDVPLEVLNLTEKKRFMDGEKHIAIISEAASSGISLQADRRVRNQRRRVHITLELPWSADRAIQQFGRTHRSNQVTAPEYLFLISELAGERRFASIVAKRLESLGALTHGDRRATESRDLSQFNIDNKYGRASLESVMKAVMGQESPLVPPPASYKGDFFEDVRRGLIGVGMITIDERYNVPMLDREYNSMSKFLNRILGMEVELQNKLFAFFSDTLNALIQQAKRNGRWDMGILGSQVSAERGLSWEGAINIWKDQTGSEDGFYVSQQVRNNKRTAILAMQTSTNLRRRLYRVYRPNTGRQLKLETLDEIRKKYKKISVDDAKGVWVTQYSAAETQCCHAFWRGNCKKKMLGLSCEVGLRRRTFHILSGSVLSVWSKVENVLASQGGNNSKVQLIRLRAEDGTKVVGCLIPSNCVLALQASLSQESEITLGAQKNPVSLQTSSRPPTVTSLPVSTVRVPMVSTAATATVTKPSIITKSIAPSSMPVIL
ncbi:protein strawberry notch homolog 1-like [Saccoglossus kowalevskii]